MNTGCGCRSITCGGCFLIILLIAAIIALVVLKPQSIWNKSVGFLNKDVEVREFNNTTYESAIATVNSQIQTVGDNRVVLSEDQLTALSRNSLNELKDLVIDLDQGNIEIYWKWEQSIQDKPLYGMAVLSETSSQNFEIKKFGTARLSIPGFVNKYINDVLFSVLNIASSDNTDYSVVRTLISLNKEAKITEVEIDGDQMILTINVGVNIFE